VGVGISFTPLPGTHFLQAAFFSWLLRGNIPASMIATLAGNPWTFPLMWYAAYVTGYGIFKWVGLPLYTFPQGFTLGDVWHGITHDPFGLMVPWIVGGYLCAVFFGVVVFYLSLPLIRRQKKEAA
jgi:hypothetical protein